MEKQGLDIVWQNSSDKGSCITTDHFTCNSITCATKCNF